MLRLSELNFLLSVASIHILLSKILGQKFKIVNILERKCNAYSEIYINKYRHEVAPHNRYRNISVVK